jgi:hypothetical protein
MLFVHVPKTGGMSTAEYLLTVLPRPVYYTGPDTGEEETDTGIVQVPGRRHQSLEHAKNVVREYGFDIFEFPLILAVLRNPYSLEVSRYAYLRTGHRWDRGADQKLALTGNFEAFVSAEGSVEIPWIEGDKSYEFRLYANKGRKKLLATTVVTRRKSEVISPAIPSSTSRSGRPFIVSSPNPVPAGLGLGTTMLSWGTSDGSGSEVYVSVDGGPERLVVTQHDSLPKTLKSYFLLDGSYPENLKIVKFENLPRAITQSLHQVGIDDTAAFPWENRSNHCDYTSYYNESTEEAVYHRYKWVFDEGFYDRLGLASQ